MIVVDTSILVAIILRETDAGLYSDILSDSSKTFVITAANYLEACIVIDSKRMPIMSEELDELIANYQIAIIPVTEAMAKLARKAYQKYGRGSGHKANLNFGDCFAYAASQVHRAPLLFQGTDFAATDVLAAVQG